MSKKKVLAMAASLALVAVIGVGATLAYFTDKTDTKTNVVTMGKVDINLEEDSVEDNGQVAGEIKEEGIDFTNVMPGDVLSKIPKVTVAEDSQEAYIRVKIEIEPDEILSGADIDSNAIFKWLDIDGSKWVKGQDDYFYYQEIANPLDELTLFTKVTVPSTLGNNAAEGSFNIKIQAEAIQSQNVTPVITGEQITGWPQADIEALT